KAAWQQWFDAVADDLRAALAWSLWTEQVDHADYALAMALGHLAYARRFLVEGRDHYATAVTCAPDEVAAVEALRMAAAAAFAEMRGDAAFELLTEAHRRAAAA